MTGLVGWAVVVVVAWPALAFARAAARTGADPGAGRTGALRDRRDVLDGLAAAVLGVVLARGLGPWEELPAPAPALVWAVPVAGLVLGAGVSAVRWRRLPWSAPGRSRPAALTAAVLSAALLVGAGALVVEWAV